MPDRIRRTVVGAWVRLSQSRLPPWWPVAVLAAVVGLQLLLPDLAFARGGGAGHSGGGAHTSGGGGGGSHGGGFPGGGFHGGGGFGGGGGGFGGFYFLPFVFGGGFIFLLLILLLIFVVYTRTRSGPVPFDSDSTWNEPASTRLQVLSNSEPALAQIAAADPGFDRAGFLARVGEAFMRLQQAWQDRDLAGARPYMGEGLYLSWETQIGQLASLHKKNILEGLEILGTRIASASHGPRFEHISVQVDARAADYEVDERTNQVVFGDRVQREFSEYWTFERTTGALTPAAGGILDQKCPVCGAPLAINEVGECEYCSAAITSGKYDWVLARIDQADEWEARTVEASYGGAADTPAVAPAALAGVAAIVAADPAFDADAFTERAEMAFFLIEHGWQEGRLEPVKPYLSPSIYESWQAEADTLAAKGQRNLLENLNVQGITIVEAGHSDVVDRVKVRIDAVAANQLVTADSGVFVTGDRSDRRFTEYWTFQRPAGTATAAAGGVLAHKCPQCGRPLSLNESGQCTGCGAAITSGRFDWSLLAIQRDPVLV
jgi:predicted lipid-binding transport protein (Tim44 family)